MPERDGFCVMLSTGAHGGSHPNGLVGGDTWDAYFWIADADALFAQATAAGAAVVYPPTLKEYYGMMEFAIRDLDGYVLAFGQDAGGE